VVLRVDSPGGDALASDLMWREIQQLAEKKPVVACMGDVAASGGYYMSMAAQVRSVHAARQCSAGLVTLHAALVITTTNCWWL
jgi:ClpP class serine protease